MFQFFFFTLQSIKRKSPLVFFSASTTNPFIGAGITSSPFPYNCLVVAKYRDKNRDKNRETSFNALNSKGKERENIKEIAILTWD